MKEKSADKIIKTLRTACEKGAKKSKKDTSISNVKEIKKKVKKMKGKKVIKVNAPPLEELKTYKNILDSPYKTTIELDAMSRREKENYLSQLFLQTIHDPDDQDFYELVGDDGFDKGEGDNEFIYPKTINGKLRKRSKLKKK